MTQHLTEEQFISYINHTLTDAEREAIDRHLTGCHQCRTPLADHEAFARRLQYDLVANLRIIQPSVRMNFRAITPHMKRSRRLIVFAQQSNKMLVGVATLALLVSLGMGLFMLVNNLSQPAPLLQPEIAESIPAIVEGEGQPETVPVEAVEPPPNPVELAFTVYGDQPILTPGPYVDLAWDRLGVEPGATIFHDGQYHMFYNGADRISQFAIGHATSPDGFMWTPVDSEPLLTADDVGFAKVGVKASSVLVEDNGTWVIYFSTWNEPAGYSTSDIGRLTAPTPDGPWTLEPMPVLEPGPDGSWDGYAVLDPSVVRTDDGYVMYYTGLNSFAGTQKIGMATSPDGLTWTKYNDRDTGETLFSESDPILLPGEPDAWDGKRVLDPTVQQTPDGWVMVYTSVKNASGGGDHKIGYATSADGQQWTRAGELPDLAELLTDWLSGASLLYHEGIYYLYFTVPKDDLSSNVFLATAGQPPH